MRKETIMISERDLMFVIAGQLFDQAPNRQPRKAEIIMQKVRDAFRSQAVNDNEFYSIRIENEKVYDWIKDLLFSIPEFQELNLSQIEFEKGVSVDDESRPKFSFTTAYDKYDSESWKTDFIDLDAFVGNVNRSLYMIKNAEEDCFFCIYQDESNSSVLAAGNSDKCKNCCVNPDLKNNYTENRRPRGQHTFSCKYDCYKGFYICCEECTLKETCDHKCDSSSNDCGLTMFKDSKKGNE